MLEPLETALGAAYGGLYPQVPVILGSFPVPNRTPLQVIRTSSRSDESCGQNQPEQNRGKTTTNNEKRLRKGAVLQPPGPERAFKGLEIAKRYCRGDSIGDTVVQYQLIGPQRAWAPTTSPFEAKPYCLRLITFRHSLR